jgi:hypothetical protein
MEEEIDKPWPTILPQNMDEVDPLLSPDLQSSSITSAELLSLSPSPSPYPISINPYNTGTPIFNSPAVDNPLTSSNFNINNNNFNPYGTAKVITTPRGNNNNKLQKLLKEKQRRLQNFKQQVQQTENTTDTLNVVLYAACDIDASEMPTRGYPFIGYYGNIPFYWDNDSNRTPFCWYKTEEGNAKYWVKPQDINMQYTVHLTYDLKSYVNSTVYPRICGDCSWFVLHPDRTVTWKSRDKDKDEDKDQDEGEDKELDLDAEESQVIPNQWKLFHLNFLHAEQVDQTDQQANGYPLIKSQYEELIRNTIQSPSINKFYQKEEELCQLFDETVFG